MTGVPRKSAQGIPGKRKYPVSILFVLLLGQWIHGQRTILWKVSEGPSDKTSYIVGTFHQFGNSFVDSIPQIKAALLNSELAVFESIAKVEDTREMIQRREVSHEIETWLRKRELEELKELTKDWKVDLYRLSPLEIRWKLQQQYQKIKCKTVKSTDTFDHFDSYLQYLAEENGIGLLGLETDSMQLNLIERANRAPNWRAERKILRAWIDLLTSDGPDETICELADNYRNFKLGYDFESPCTDDILVRQRNRDWMTVLPELIRKKNTFIALGYFHLKNKCSILEQLKEQGFSVEPVPLGPVPDTP